MIRNIIFDWSGTLVDDLPAVVKATNYVFERAGHERRFTIEEFRSEFCLPFTRFYQRFLAHVPMAQLEEWFHGHFREVQDSVEPIPHAREFLEFAKAKDLRTLLLSTIHPEYYATQSAKTGFASFVQHPYTRVWDKCEKIHEILETHDLKPEETLFVGDMQHDVETARHAGLISCAVLTGYNRLDQLRESRPDLIVENLDELRRILKANELQFPFFQKIEENGQLPVATVGALIFDGTGRVLMIRTQKWSHLWGIPGGKIKYNETSEDALRREVREETGLRVDQVKFVMVQDCIQSPEFYREAHFLLLNYTCRATGETKVVLNEEAREFQWVSAEESLKMKLNQPTRILILEVLKRRKETK